MQREVAPRLLAFWRHFQESGGAARTALSVRDLLAWARFVAAAAPDVDLLPAYAHGAYLVLLDGIGLGLGMPVEVRQRERNRTRKYHQQNIDICTFAYTHGEYLMLLDDIGLGLGMPVEALRAVMR